MIEKPYLVHWSDDSDHNTEAVATLDEAQDEIDRWLDLRRREADDGWALDMTGCIAVIVERVVEEESEAPEGSSFDRHVDYHRERVPDPRDPRIAALEAEVAALKASAEADADAVSEYAAISALMAADPVLCRYGMLEAFEMLKARADEACGEPAPPVVDRDALRDAIADALGSSAYDCARVWSAWSYGTMSQDDFRHLVDDEDRLMEIVDAVVGVLKVTPEPAPLRLGRGPTVEEVEAVAAKQSDGLGWWMLNFGGDGIAWEVCSLYVEDGAVLLDSGMSVYGFHDITDAIPLSPSRQPCGVGVKL